MAKKDKVVQQTGHALATLVSLVAWLTGVIVALAVGFGLTSGTLGVPGLGALNGFAGWVVIVLTVLGAALALIEKFTN